jgi:hypothetical protein
MAFSFVANSDYYRIDQVVIGFRERSFSFVTEFPCARDSVVWFVPVVSTGNPRPGFVLAHTDNRTVIMAPPFSGDFTPFPSSVDLRFNVGTLPFEVPRVLAVSSLDVMQVEPYDP